MKEKYGIGTIHTNNKGEQFEIIGKVEGNNHKRIIRFKDRLQYIVEVDVASIYIKNIRNPNYPSYYGVGYIGEKYDSDHPLFVTWRCIISRCYDKTHISYKYYGAKGVTVHEDWYCFSTFVDDVLYSNKVKGGEILEQMRMVKNYDGIKFEIDKDFSGKNIYSIDTVTIVTKAENNKEKDVRRNKL